MKKFAKSLIGPALLLVAVLLIGMTIFHTEITTLDAPAVACNACGHERCLMEAQAIADQYGDDGPLVDWSDSHLIWSVHTPDLTPKEKKDADRDTPEIRPPMRKKVPIRHGTPLYC